MLSIEEVLELEEDIREELDNHLEEILIKLNRTGQIQELLSLLGLDDKSEENLMDDCKSGKIVVIGTSEVSKDKLAAVAKRLGIDTDRFEFFLNYDDAKTFNFRKLQYNSNYSLIMVGSMPHSGHAKGDYSSVITALEREEGYPPVRRMGSSRLNISKSSFRSDLESLIQEKMIA